MKSQKIKVPIETSARHVHLDKKDFEKLFGKEKNLESIKKLSQPGEFASKYKIDIINGKKILSARVIGPLRENSQVEMSLTDAYNLNLNPLPKIKISGDLKGTTQVLIKSSKGQIKIPVIIAQRHLHCSEEDAKKLKLKNNSIINVEISVKRGLIFENVIVRVKENFRTSVHLDTDEANAAGISGKVFGEIVK